MADTNEIYLALVDLELDHENIRKEGNIMDYERKAKVPSALHQKRVNNLRNKLEDHQNLLRNTCNTAQPTQDSITQLYDRIGNAKKFISDYHNKYPHYWEEKILDTMLNKLKYTLKIATSKLEELENLDDKIQSNITSRFKQHFQKLTPDPGIGDDTESNQTTPKPKLYKNFASVGYIRISESKHNI